MSHSISARRAFQVTSKGSKSSLVTCIQACYFIFKRSTRYTRNEKTFQYSFRFHIARDSIERRLIVFSRKIKWKYFPTKGLRQTIFVLKLI